VEGFVEDGYSMRFLVRAILGDDAKSGAVKIDHMKQSDATLLRRHGWPNRVLAESLQATTNPPIRGFGDLYHRPKALGLMASCRELNF
jgi:hypothetical protein